MTLGRTPEERGEAATGSSEKPKKGRVTPLGVILLIIFVVTIFDLLSKPDFASDSSAEPAQPQSYAASHIAEPQTVLPSATSSPDNGGGTTDAPAAARVKFNLAKLRKGQAYGNVRNVLMANGFEPARYEQRDCSPYGNAPGEECFDRPEIWYCSGTGQGFCTGYWLKGEIALGISVAEGPDGVFDEAFEMTKSGVISVVGQDGGRLIN